MVLKYLCDLHLQKADMLATIATNLQRYESPLSAMVSSERTWVGVHRFVSTNEDGFDDLEEVIDELVTQAQSRVSLHMRLYTLKK